MRIDVWSDVVCPWCYIGLANLGLALDEFEHDEDVDVVLHSYQLDPDAPERDDQPLAEQLAAKYGTSVGQIKAQQARIVSMGAERGIDFRFDQSIRGNTFDAHRLLHLARARGVQLELKHALGQAYFTDGEAIGEADTLRRAAIGVGLDPVEVDTVLGGDAFADDVRSDIELAQRIGISGVPFFVVDGRLGVSGAQPPESLLDVIEQGWLTRAPAPVTVVAGGGPTDDACGPDGCEI